MSDIVDRLEERAVSYEQSGPSAHHTAALLREAKVEIENIRAEHEIMRKTLETIAANSADRLQATQARGALANIGPAFQ